MINRYTDVVTVCLKDSQTAQDFVQWVKTPVNHFDDILVGLDVLGEDVVLIYDRTEYDFDLAEAEEIATCFHNGDELIEFYFQGRLFLNYNPYWTEE